MNNYRFQLFLVLVLVALAGCAGNSSSRITATVPPTQTWTAAPTGTRPPTFTPLPTQTTTIVPVPVLETPTPTPLTDFSSARIYSVGFLPDWRFLVTIETLDDIQGEYYAVIQTNKQYKCEKWPTYSNRLYCHGPLVAVDDHAKFVLYDKSNDHPVFTQTVYIPMFRRYSSSP